MAVSTVKDKIGDALQALSNAKSVKERNHVLDGVLDHCLGWFHRLEVEANNGVADAKKFYNAAWSAVELLSNTAASLSCRYTGLRVARKEAEEHLLQIEKQLTELEGVA